MPSHKYTIQWIALEGNPDVFNAWARKAGLVDSDYEFSDIYGLEPELLAMVSQPVKAVVLLFPGTDVIDVEAVREDERIKTEGQHPISPKIIWIKQTINNACGAMALLHAVANTDVALAPGSPLEVLFEGCKEKTPHERAKLLETTAFFSDVHTEMASSGQSAVPEPGAWTEFHYTCFVQAPDPLSPDAPLRLLELDGGRNGPIDRGESTELLEDVARFVKEHHLSRTASMQFSMMALASSV